MSVLIPDVKVYGYIHSGMIKAAYRTECDAYHASCIYSHFRYHDIEKESKRLVKSWAALNEESYDVRYKQTGDSLQEFINFRKNYDVNIYQLLKYVLCVQYNIEADTIEEVRKLTEAEKDDLEILNKWAGQIQYAIIDQMEEYKKAKWSEVA